MKEALHSRQEVALNPSTEGQGNRGPCDDIPGRPGEMNLLSDVKSNAIIQIKLTNNNNNNNSKESPLHEVIDDH